MTRRNLVLVFAVVASLALGVLGGVLLSSRSEPNEADLGFARDMTTHHLQAVEMASLARERSSDPEVRLLAYDIEMTQAGQVGQMQGWLSAWGALRNSPDVMRWMGHDHSGMSATMMPGMASPEELSNLRSLEGAEFDVEFLRLMLAHHEGGLDMADAGVELASRPEVRLLAERIGTAQAAESELLADMLSERSPGSAPSSLEAPAQEPVGEAEDHSSHG